jgi:hypothetical protein
MSGLHEGIPRTVFQGQFDPPSFALALAHKDISLATELAREYNVPMPVANLAEQIAIQGMVRGWGNRDSKRDLFITRGGLWRRGPEHHTWMQTSPPNSSQPILKSSEE